MKGWRVSRLGDVCRLINGRAYKKNELLEDGPTPVIRVGNFFTNKSWYYSDLELDEEKYCDNGDLLYAWSASFGPRIWDGDRAIFHYHIWRMEPNTEVVDKKFLYYFLAWDKERIKAEQGAGTTMIHVTKESMEKRHFAFPPLGEQQRIAAVLDETFAGIATATANAEKNLSNARELFDSTLYSVFNQKGDDWTKKTLKQVSLEFGRGKSKHRPRNDPKLYGDRYPFIQTGDVRNADRLITQCSQFYNEFGLAQSKLWPSGTICITIAANIAETGILTFDACFPDSVIGIVVNPDKTTNDFVEYALQSVKMQLKAKGKGSAQDNINLATFENLLLPFPPLEEQRRLVSHLNSLLESVQTLENNYISRLSALAELKQSILQKAFAGELIAEQGLGVAAE